MHMVYLACNAHGLLGMALQTPPPSRTGLAVKMTQNTCVWLQYLEKFNGIKFQEPVWFKSGAIILNEPLNYLGQPNLIGARSIIATLAVQVHQNPIARPESAGHLCRAVSLVCICAFMRN